MGAIPATAKVFPVLVTFDDLCENPALNQWVDLRCKKLGVLQGADVAPPLMITLDGLESLLALVSNGYSLRQLMATKASVDRHVSLTGFVVKYSPDGKELRLPALATRFDALTTQTMKTLFPHLKMTIAHDPGVPATIRLEDEAP